MTQIIIRADRWDSPVIFFSPYHSIPLYSIKTYSREINVIILETIINMIWYIDDYIIDSKVKNDDKKLYIESQKYIIIRDSIFELIANVNVTVFVL